jgi:hypothetical protein
MSNESLTMEQWAVFDRIIDEASRDCVFLGGEHLLCHVSTARMSRTHCLRCLYDTYKNGVFATRTEGLDWIEA